MPLRVRVGVGGQRGGGIGDAAQRRDVAFEAGATVGGEPQPGAGAFADVALADGQVATAFEVDGLFGQRGLGDGQNSSTRSPVMYSHQCLPNRQLSRWAAEMPNVAANAGTREASSAGAMITTGENITTFCPQPAGRSWAAKLAKAATAPAATRGVGSSVAARPPPEPGPTSTRARPHGRPA